MVRRTFSSENVEYAIYVIIYNIIDAFLKRQKAAAHSRIHCIGLGVNFSIIIFHLTFGIRILLMYGRNVFSCNAPKATERQKVRQSHRETKYESKHNATERNGRKDGGEQMIGNVCGNVCEPLINFCFSVIGVCSSG